MRRKTPPYNIGSKVGMLTILGEIPGKDANGKVIVACMCDCGSFCTTRLHRLVNGRSVSCGCKKTKHGNSRRGKENITYTSWGSMISRCTNKNDVGYARYGGSGISVCKEWLESFDAFVGHIGERPSSDFSIDRIDNSLGYFPGNVRWATRTEQAQNKKNNLNVFIDGESMCVLEFCRRYGVSKDVAYLRFRNGKTSKEELLAPPRQIKRSK